MLVLNISLWGEEMMKRIKVSLVILVAIGLMLASVGCGGGNAPGTGGSNEPRTQISRFEDAPTALNALLAGGVDAVVADKPVVMAYLENNPNAGVIAFGDDAFEIEYYGIAMRHEDVELHALVNEGLARVKESGIYDKLINKYFNDGPDVELKPMNNELGMTLQVGMDAAYAPFEYVDEATNQIVGFDAELIKAIAAEMGFAVELNNVPWDGIIPALTSGKIDILISAMTITEERARTVTFSDPYFEATQFIAVKEGSPIKSLADLRGKRIGVQNGTTGDLFVSEFFGQ